MNDINTFIAEKISLVCLRSKYGFINGMYSSIMAVVIASAATIWVPRPNKKSIMKNMIDQIGLNGINAKACG